MPVVLINLILTAANGCKSLFEFFPILVIMPYNSGQLVVVQVAHSLLLL